MPFPALRSPRFNNSLIDPLTGKIMEHDGASFQKKPVEDPTNGKILPVKFFTGTEWVKTP